MPYTLGVDLGTTTSAAAIKRDGRLEPCSLGEATMTTPSIVLSRDDGRTLIGEAAAMHGGVAPLRMVRFAHIGLPGTAGAQRTLPPNTSELVALLLDNIVGQVADGLGARPERVVIAQPAAACGEERELFRQLASEVLSDEVLVVSAPVAAATMVAREYHMGPGTTLGLLDLSGDLCEVTLVCRTDDGLELLGRPATTAGATGAEVDTLVFRHIDAALGNMVSALDPAGDADAVALQRLATACRQASQQLLYDNETVIEVGLPRLTARVRLTRRDLQKLIRPRVTRSVAALERSLDEASLTPADLHAIVLVGGPARLAMVSELIAERFACPVIVDALPEMTVALGAALRGAPDEPPVTAALPTIGDAAPLASSTGEPQPVAAAVTAMPAGTSGGAAGGQSGDQRGRRVDHKLVLASLILVVVMLVSGALVVAGLGGGAKGDPVDSIGTSDGDATSRGVSANDAPTSGSRSSTTTTPPTTPTTEPAEPVDDTSPTPSEPEAPSNPSPAGEGGSDAGTTASPTPPPEPPNAAPSVPGFPDLPSFGSDFPQHLPDNVWPPPPPQMPAKPSGGASAPGPQQSQQDLLTSLFGLLLE